MKSFYAILIFILFTFTLSSQNTIYNSTFGNNGILNFHGVSPRGEATRSAITPLGNIVVAYAANNANYDFIVYQFRPDGSLDTSFGDHGMVTLFFDIFPEHGAVHSIAVQPDGKIILAGSSFVGNVKVIGVIRLSISGQLDNTFDADGKAKFSIPGGNAFNTCMSIQADDKILIGGRIEKFDPTDSDDSFVLRLKSDGSLDNTFGSFGKLIIDLGDGLEDLYAISALPNEKIYISGSKLKDNSVNGYLMRLNNDGSTDNTFGSLGLITNIFNRTSEVVLDMKILSDSKILFSGIASNNTRTTEMVVSKLLANGDDDISFGINGVFSLGLTEISYFGYSMAVQNDNKIAVAVTGALGNINSITPILDYSGDIIRLTKDGKLDANFNTSGIIKNVFKSDLPKGHQVDMVHITPDQNILAVGWSSNAAQIVNLALAKINSNTTTVGIESLNLAFTGHPKLIYASGSHQIKIYFSLSQPTSIGINLIDLSGKLIERLSSASVYSPGNYSIPFSIYSPLSAGVYIVILNSPKGSLALKFLKP